MEHNEGCLNRSKSFPCCEDQMCPCDSYYFEKLKAENARYRKALEFYADRSSWNWLKGTEQVADGITVSDVSGYEMPGIELCGGRRARDALKEIGE